MIGERFTPDAPTYGWLLLLLLAARGADFLSTWIATPRLMLEGNPIARRLGWRWGALVNLLACAVCALLPLAAIVVATTSVLVAARNFQGAWLMRAMGEERYRAWHAERLQETPYGLFALCLAAQILLVGAVGVALVVFAERPDSVPFAVGLGVVTYALAVALYTVLAVWRRLRS